MKILVIGDPHGKLPKGLNNIVKKNGIEVIICTGDIPFTPKNPTDPKSWKGVTRKANKSYGEIIKKLCSYNLPVLTLIGNMYSRGKSLKLTKRIFNKYKNIFNKRVGKININEQNFIFFDMLWEKHAFRKKGSEKFLNPNKSREKRLNHLLNSHKDSIVISHSPPFECLDKIHSGKHVGSKILLKAIKKHKPKYVFCGHIHEAKGKKKIGKTTVYNVGSCGDYVVVDI